MTSQHTVKLRNLIAYGMGDLFGGGSFLLISMFYLFFLTEEAGLSPALAGLVLSAGKVWDAVSDPLMGFLSDRTRSRLGRRRVYFLAGIVPIAVSFYLLWLPVRASSPEITALYYGFAYIVFNTVFTMVMIPYTALNAEMSTDYRVRTRLSGARSLFSLISAALAGTIPPMLLNRAATPEQGYFWISILFGLLYALPWLAVFAGTWESEAPPGQPSGQQPGQPAGQPPPFHLLGALRDIASLLRNRVFCIHLAMYICAYTAMDMLMFLFRYYLKWYIGNEAIMTHTMGALMGAQIVTIPVYVSIANRRGKAVAFRVGLTLFGAGMLLASLLDSQSTLTSVMGVCALIGSGLSAAVMMPWAMLPSVIDVDELMTTQMRSGMYSGVMTLIRKLIQGLFATQLITWSMGAIGYVERATEQSGETIESLRILFLGMPFLFIILGIAASLRFRVTPTSHAVLTRELERLRAGGARDDVDPQTRSLLEQLTGTSYDQLYRRAAPHSPTEATK